MRDPASKKVMGFPTMTIKLSSSLHTNPGKWSLGRASQMWVRKESSMGPDSLLSPAILRYFHGL